MRPTNFDINEVIESLKGTCDDFDSCAMRMYEMVDSFDFTVDCTAEELATLDNEIFLCGECGWWCELCEANTEIDDIETYCTDCKPEHD